MTTDVIGSLRSRTITATVASATISRELVMANFSVPLHRGFDENRGIYFADVC
jgi:hypothetical protein